MNMDVLLDDQRLDELSNSPEYADYIMNNCFGDRRIANGDDLIIAMEEGYLFDSFLETQYE